MKLELQSNGYYTGIEAGREVYFYEMYGHTGYIKLAVALTEGVELRNQRGKSNQLGCSNPGVYVKFVDGPDDQVLAKLLENYSNLCKQRKAIKNEVKPMQTKKAKAARPERDFKTWKVSMTGINAANYPSYVIDAYTAEEAKESYEMLYNMKHENRLGNACFWLKASRQ